MADVGLAKTTQFLLSTATVMVGPTAEVFELTPAKHSLGLVKNVRATTEPKYTELMQGLSNTLVYSAMTEMMATIQMEVYEFTRRNLSYAVGLDASGAAYDTGAAPVALNAALTSASTAIVIAGAGNLTGWAVDDWIVMQAENGDLIWIAQVATMTAATRTLTWDNVKYPLPAGVTWSTAGTSIYNVKPTNIGVSSSSLTLGAKIVGVLPEGSEPVTLIYPKVRITKGLDLSFQSNDFANMPFEIKPYALVSTDPLYPIFPNNQLGKIFKL